MITAKHRNIASSFLMKHIFQEKGTLRQNEVHRRAMDEWHLYLEAMEAKATKDRKEQEENVQQVTQQNATLINMIQQQQKTIGELITTSKSLMNKMAGTLQNQESNCNKMGDTTIRQGKKKKLYSWVYQNVTQSRIKHKKDTHTKTNKDFDQQKPRTMTNNPR